MKNFNYIDHYQKDAAEFDYFEERKGATAHDERRVREYIFSKASKECRCAFAGVFWLQWMHR